MKIWQSLRCAAVAAAVAGGCHGTSQTSTDGNTSWQVCAKASDCAPDDECRCERCVPQCGRAMTCEQIQAHPSCDALSAPDDGGSRGDDGGVHTDGFGSATDAGTAKTDAASLSPRPQRASGGRDAAAPNISRDAGLADSDLAMDRRAGYAVWSLKSGKKFQSVGVDRKRFSCGVDVDGGLHCWGRAPGNPPNVAFRSVDGGDGYACGLTAAGEVKCWSSDAGVSEVAAPPGVFAALVAGFSQSCVLDATGKATCWGDPGYTPPAAKFSAIATNDGVVCGIDATKAIVCWGPSVDGGALPGQVSGTYRALSVGPHAVCAIDDTGTIRCRFDPAVSAMLPPSGAFTVVSVADQHACAIAVDHTIDCWARAGATPSTEPAIAPPPGDFSAIDSGQGWSCALGSSGDAITCWGDDFYGQSGTGLGQ